MKMEGESPLIHVIHIMDLQGYGDGDHTCIYS